MSLIDFLVKNSPIIGLFIFLTIFLTVIFLVLRPKSKKKFEEFARIPLDEETVNKEK
jgi:cbb3-type cytochrome oxidase subunit 3